MAQATATKNSRRTIAFTTAICAVLDTAVQVGLGVLSVRASSYWFYLVGTPMVYVLTTLIGAFCISGGPWQI
jgi:hypothetical protein